LRSDVDLEFTDVLTTKICRSVNIPKKDRIAELSGMVCAFLKVSPFLTSALGSHTLRLLLANRLTGGK
jgi:hypothetical protein